MLHTLLIKYRELLTIPLVTRQATTKLISFIWCDRRSISSCVLYVYPTHTHAYPLRLAALPNIIQPLGTISM